MYPRSDSFRSRLPACLGCAVRREPPYVGRSVRLDTLTIGVLTLQLAGDHVPVAAHDQFVRFAGQQHAQEVDGRMYRVGRFVWPVLTPERPDAVRPVRGPAAFLPPERQLTVQPPPGGAPVVTVPVRLRGYEQRRRGDVQSLGDGDQVANVHPPLPVLDLVDA